MALTENRPYTGDYGRTGIHICKSLGTCMFASHLNVGIENDIVTKDAFESRRKILI